MDLLNLSPYVIFYTTLFYKNYPLDFYNQLKYHAHPSLLFNFGYIKSSRILFFTDFYCFPYKLVYAHLLEPYTLIFLFIIICLSIYFRLICLHAFVFYSSYHLININRSYFIAFILILLTYHF